MDLVANAENTDIKVEPDEAEEVYLSKEDYDRLQRFHKAYPIPAITRGFIKLVCTDDIEVKEEVDDTITSSPRHNSSNCQATPFLVLWDSGRVVELTPQIDKITISVSELRNKIRNLNVPS